MEIAGTDVVFLLARIVLAAVLFVHGTQKVFGWFAGPGMTVAEKVFESLGQRPARPMLLLAVATEIISSLLLVAGLFVPLAAAMGAGAMIVAAAAQNMVSKNFANAKGGGEYPAVLAAFAIVLAPAAGALSLDGVFGFAWARPGVWEAVLITAGALVLAFLAAAGPLVMTKKAIAAREASEAAGAAAG